MPNSLVSAHKFAELAQTGTVPGDTCVSHALLSVVKAESDARQIEFTISTDSVDRAGDVVAVDGWDTAAYEANPVMLYAHNSDWPVGKALKLWPDGASIKASVEFADKWLGIGPNPAVLEDYYRKGFLSAVSVGFRPLEWEWSKDRKGGIDFKRQELLEFSAVSVPANPNALMSKSLYKSLFGMESIRDFEDFLRDVGGFSHKQAKAIASRGFGALRDAENEAELAASVVRALTDFRASLR